MSVIPTIKMVERIEIVKGGNSALYGSDAVGGVVNIITKKGTRDETTIDINTGSWKRRTFEITNQGSKGKFSWFVAGKVARYGYTKYIDGAEDVGHWPEEIYRRKTIKLGSPYTRNSAFIRLDNRFDDRSSLTLHSSLIEHAFRSVTFSYNFKEGTSTPGWLRYFNDSIPDGAYVLGSSRMQGVEYQNGWELRRHKIIAGLEWHRYNVSWTSNLHYEGKATNKAAYVQDTISLGDKWKVVSGVRYDHDSESGSHWSPKISVNYRADEKTKFYGAWGRVYNPPTNVQLYACPENEMPGGYYHYGNPNLASEEGHTETIGMEHAFDDDTSIAVNYFHGKMDKVYQFIDPTYKGETVTNGVFAEKLYNLNVEKRHGIEISFNKRLSDKWSVNFGYAHIRGVDYNHSPFGIMPLVRYTQPNGYRIGIHYACGPWKANLLGNIGEGYEMSTPQPAKCVVLDFNVSYDVKDFLTVYARVRNLTNQDYGYMSGNLSSPKRFFQIGATCRF